MVRNEKDSQGNSIAERYGPPVTVSDVEDLLYRERVPASTIYKIMQAVRQAVTWNRAAAVRPWAGDLEDGLTRQEDRRAEQRRAALADALREEGRRRAAAAETDAPNVNSQDPKEALGEALADAWATAAGADAPGSRPAAKLSLLQGGAGTITPAALPEPATALSEASVVDEVAAEVLNLVAEADKRFVSEVIGSGTPSFTGLIDVLNAAPATPPADAPASPAAAPQAVADPAPGTVPPPAPPEPPTGRSEAPAGRKTCSRCHAEWDIDFFQRDKRASDGRRPDCKRCTGRYDAMRRGLKKSLHASTESAVDEAVDAMEAAEPVATQEQLDAVFAQFRPLLPELPPDTRGETVILIPKFDPPDIDEEPEEDDGLRECRACHIRKSEEDDYYKRSDGRVRYVCKECEKQASRNAKLRRLARD